MDTLTFEEIYSDKWIEFGNAIILQAIKDYRRGLRKLKKNPFDLDNNVLLIEKFFRGPVFSTISDLDPEWLIKKLKDEVFCSGNKTAHAN